MKKSRYLKLKAKFAINLIKELDVNEIKEFILERNRQFWKQIQAQFNGMVGNCEPNTVFIVFERILKSIFLFNLAANDCCMN